MNVKKIRNTAVCTLLMTSFIMPSLTVKADDGSRTETYRAEKTLTITLKDTYKNQNITNYSELPEELKKLIEAQYVYKKDGFEGTLDLSAAKLRPVESSKTVTYKPIETKTVTNEIASSKKSHPLLGTQSTSFPNTSLKYVTNPFTGKSQRVAMTKEGKPKLVSTTESSFKKTFEGRFAMYDRNANQAYGIMSNSSQYIRGATKWGNSDAWSWKPDSKIYLGALFSPFNASYINKDRLDWKPYVKASDVVGMKWSSMDGLRIDADEMGNAIAGWDDKMAGNALHKVLHGPIGGGWYFRSEEGNLNKYRRGIDMTYAIRYKSENYTQMYAYTFSKPREIDYNSYSTWVVDLTYKGKVHDMRQKNFDISYVRFNPGTVIIPNEITTISQKTSVTFDVGYTVYPASNIQASPKVTVYKGSVPLWTGSVPVNPGTKTRRTINLGSINYNEGNNLLRVVVNPGKTIVELKPKKADPYTDNEGKNSVNGVKSEKCFIFTNAIKRTQNNWIEKWSIITQVGNVATDGEGNKHAVVVSRDEQNEEKSYTEKYEIKEIYFRSKYTKDYKYNDLPSKGEGWQKLANNSVATIKAGYGFEIFARTVYTTNRNVGASITETFSNPYSSGKYGEGFASFKMISPGIGETITPSALNMTMQSGSGGATICAILEQTAKGGDWWNEVKTFEIQNKASVGGVLERKVYTSETSMPGVYDISIASPAPSSPAAFSGYEAESPTGGGGAKPKLYDYLKFRLEILAQDDIKSHIGN